LPPKETNLVIAFETAATSEYAEMALRALQPEQCALLVIDIQ